MLQREHNVASNPLFYNLSYASGVVNTPISTAKMVYKRSLKDENGETSYQRGGRKAAITKSIPDLNGVSIAQLSARKAAVTRNIAKDDGTTIAEIARQKANSTKLILDENGETSNQRGGRKSSETKSSKQWKDEHSVECPHCNMISTSAWIMSKYHNNNCFKLDLSRMWNVYHETDSLLYSEISKQSMNVLHKKLIISSHTNRIGNTCRSKSKLIKHNKEHLIGAYAIRLDHLITR